MLPVTMAGFLDEIVAETRRRLSARQREVPERVLREGLSGAPPVRDFAAALAPRIVAHPPPGVIEAPPGAGAPQGASAPRRLGVIAEIKRASPSAGFIRRECDPAAIARSYEANGASAISVLTEPAYFKGSLDDLRAARAAVGCPVLRKDFIVEPYQLLEARTAGADAVLLIAAILDDDLLRHLLSAAGVLGMGCLVEVHSQGELERVLATDAAVVGINNRDLATFRVDLGVTEQLLARNDLGGRLVVSESGIACRADLDRLAGAGVDAVLVGTALMRAEDPGLALARLLGGATQFTTETQRAQRRTKRGEKEGG